MLIEGAGVEAHRSHTGAAFFKTHPYETIPPSSPLRCTVHSMP